MTLVDVRDHNLGEHIRNRNIERVAAGNRAHYRANIWNSSSQEFLRDRAGNVTKPFIQPSVK